MIVEGEVRELIRQRGINPLAEIDIVDRLIDEVTADYLDRSVNSALPPLGFISIYLFGCSNSIHGI
jgi:pilus assembly protein CpaF